ncbi:MAG: histidine kinase [Verrucomicrobiota bacterium]
MSCIPGLIGFLALSLSAMGAGAAEETSWDGHLAEKFSGRWKEIQKELAELAPQMKGLPGIPIDDQGGSGGYVGVYSLAEPVGNARFAVDIYWQQSAMVDLVALVPARRYDAKGLVAQYGLPDAFEVDLLDAAGNVIGRVARERNTGANPVRKGHPFLYQVSPPVEAMGLRISATLLHPDLEENKFIHAWAEAMVFEGEKNVALGAKVRSISGGSSSAPWHWKEPFLVDGQTPLGLPEVPAADHGNIGWISEGRASAKEAASVYVDLGEPVSMDAARLIPAKKPTSDLPSGFGFPRKLSISVSETGQAGDESKWRVVSEREFLNPGHSPVVLGLDVVSARYVRIKATELWKAFDDYPAYFALSEVEILSGEGNLALGKAVSSPDGMQNLIAPGGRFWSSAGLSDGYGPDGRLISTREWLGQLDKRLRLETRRYELQIEAGQLVAGWGRTGQICLAILVLGGAFLIIALPIRYRLHATRELMQVRERIAGDLHDEVGSNLGSIQMIADLAEGRSGPSNELKKIQRIAAETVSAVRDIVWLLRPSGDHRIGTVEHMRETASIMLETLDWKFTANEDAWQVELPEESNRDLFLYFREALHNIMRHAKAVKVQIRTEKIEGHFRLIIVDDGVGIAPERLERPATLRALRQRSQALGAELKVESQPERGTRLELTVPLERKRKRTDSATPVVES